MAIDEELQSNSGLEDVIEIGEEEGENTTQTDYDGAWKQILDLYLPAFMEFFFPDVYPQIDWSRGYDVLDQELHKIKRDAKTSKRFTDKLVKVWRLDGTEQWVLIHIEIQSQQEVGFEKRVFVYFYRLYDVYNLPIATFVVLGDTTEKWKPTKYNQELWGTKLNFEYPVVKLRDYWKRWDELSQSKNPFATVVMAHLQTQASHNDPDTRYEMKLNLIRRLFKLGYEREEINNLFKFIDWLMWLPEEQEVALYDEMIALEEEDIMAYIPMEERIYNIALKKGIEQGEVKGLKQGQELGLKRGQELAQKEAEQRILQSKRSLVMRLVDHNYKLENELLKQNIEERLGLIQTENELDALIDLTLMQPVLASFMLYLPELDQKITPDDVLIFWFGKLDESGQTTIEDKAWLWWGKSEETDLLITSKFGTLMDKVVTGEHDDWLASPKGRMATIIVLDQFSRNIFRGTARAFAYDAQARRLCTEGLEAGTDRELPLIQRVFFYLPLEHAEDPELQVQSVQMYEQLVAEVSEQNQEIYANYLDYAVRHKVIIDRFGRYPHRNDILERETTPEEIAFLEEPGSSFL